jgi:hypothetical protein
VVDELFADLKGIYVFNFLDDLVVYSKSPEGHRIHLRGVLGKLEKAGFMLNKEKIVLDTSKIKYLCHLISSKGIKVLPERVEVVQRYPRPKNLRDLQKFIGMVGFYDRFIPTYSSIAAPLHALKRKGIAFVWEDDQKAFDLLKQALCEAPVLQIPDFGKEFVLVTDASDVAVSAILHQRVNGSLAPISYYSRLLMAPERKYSTYEKECLAVLFGCDKCRSYLEQNI